MTFVTKLSRGQPYWKILQIFPHFLLQLFRWICASCTHFGVYRWCIRCKDLPVQYWRSLFPFSTGFSGSISELHKKCHQQPKKKWWVAPNSAFCGASRTLSYLSSVRLSMQDGKQRHRTQNIDNMDFPTYVKGVGESECPFVKFRKFFQTWIKLVFKVIFFFNVHLLKKTHAIDLVCVDLFCVNLVCRWSSM